MGTDIGRVVRAFLVCPGLGHANRGFESFARECFDALRTDPRLDLFLYKGAGGSAGRERALPCLRRSGRPARRCAEIIGRDPYFVEQATFALALLPALVRRRPDVVMVSDGAVGNALWHWRKRARSRFRLLLSNGGPFDPAALGRFDHVHQVTASALSGSARAGRTPDSQTHLPYGFCIPAEFRTPSPEAKRSLRNRLGLPAGRAILLSVGALNDSHKRMGHLAREVARLPAPRAYVILLGNAESETPRVASEAALALGAEGVGLRSVAGPEVGDYYRAADLFASASRTEGFGRASVEALAHGLPCVVHGGPVQREVLGSFGTYADTDEPGAFAAAISGVLRGGAGDPSARHAWAYGRYSWDRLRMPYADMVLRCSPDSGKAIRVP